MKNVLCLIFLGFAGFAQSRRRPVTHDMTKPIALITAVLFVAVFGMLQAALAAKPNILHIHTDDHRPDGLSALGNPLLVTPNLDSLVERGMTFTRCYTMTGKQSKVRDVLYTAYRHCQRAIRDDQWKLIRYPLVDRTQLSDLTRDPHELENLADRPGQAARIAAMMALLQQEMTAHADTTPLTVANPQPAEWTPPASR